MNDQNLRYNTLFHVSGIDECANVCMRQSILENEIHQQLEIGVDG
jgi:hypothetical protein